MTENPLFEALDPKVNKYLSQTKNKLLKLCKDKNIEADYEDEVEDLAFLLFRYEENSKMSYDETIEAVNSVGLNPTERQHDNLMILVTYELALVDLMDADRLELEDMCGDFGIEFKDREDDELIVDIAIALLNSEE